MYNYKLNRDIDEGGKLYPRSGLGFKYRLQIEKLGLAYHWDYEKNNWIVWFKDEWITYTQYLEKSKPLPEIDLSCLYQANFDILDRSKDRMNLATVKNYEKCIIKIFAPGAAKNNTTIKTDNSTRELLINCKPTLYAGFNEIDLSVEEKVVIEEKYNLKEIKANIATGIITIKIPVDTNIISNVEIE
jgi:HSP20 family molecular chaperone IbpA